MITANTLRDNLIDKLLTISNKDYLIALNQLVEKSAVSDNIVTLTAEQISILQLSEQDIEAGRLISQEQLDKDDLQWLKEK